MEIRSHRFHEGAARKVTCVSVAALLCLSACGSSTTNPGESTGGSSGSAGGPPTGSSGGTSAASGGSPTTGSGGTTSSGSGGSPTLGGTGGTATGTGGSVGTGGGQGAGGASGAAGSTNGGTAGSSGAAGAAGASGMTSMGGGDAGAGGCTRDALKSAIDAYYVAMAAHDPTKAPLASNVKLTENGKTMMVGDGLWKTAGMVKFKRSALDTVICNSVTESVLPEGSTDRIFGVRLKLEDQKITEIETIVVRSGDYILNNPPGLSASSTDDWETPLAADKQPTRDALQKLMDDYLTKFPAGACNFASDCMRLEDGGSVGKCEDGTIVTCNPNATAGSAGMKARLHLLDTEAGISVGFTMFAGTYTDFHMFKVRDGMVHGVHACLAKASSSGWD